MTIEDRRHQAENIICLGTVPKTRTLTHGVAEKHIFKPRVRKDASTSLRSAAQATVEADNTLGKE